MANCSEDVIAVSVMLLATKWTLILSTSSRQGQGVLVLLHHLSQAQDQAMKAEQLECVQDDASTCAQGIKGSRLIQQRPDCNE